MKSLILECLRNEVKPALGCTEPVAIALTAAYAAKAIDQPSAIEKIELEVSTNILKNALNVGVPRTKRVGLEISAALGIYADAEHGLSLLQTMQEADVFSAHRLQDNVPISVKQYEGQDKVYISAEVTVAGVVHKAIVKHRHDQLTLYTVGGEIYYQCEDEAVQENAYSGLFDLKIIDILKGVLEVPVADLMFLMEGYRMNEAMAAYGIKNAPGLGLGSALSVEFQDSLQPSHLMQLAMQMTAAASDARMAGVNMQVMTSNGSGNNGLTAILPIVAADKIHKYPEGEVARAIAMSHLTNSYIKHAIGRLSSICACGVASATGAAIGISYLEGIPLDRIPHIIDTMIANLSGMACDGAKLGCSLKLSTATAAAIQSVYLLKHESYADSKNGIVGKSPEASIENLGRLARDGMKSADQVMTDILLSKFH